MTARYRFALIRSFALSAASGHPAAAGASARPKQDRLPNYADVAHLLDDVDWELVDGPVAPYGDWAVENREEFAMVGAARLPIVREVCESGRYNAVVLLGGGEPGAPAAREIARRHHLPVTTAAFSQMHVAAMLGQRFSVIDLAESHSMHYYDLVVQHRMTDRCASIRTINFPHSRPPHGSPDGRDIHEEKKKALRGEKSDAVEEAVAAAVAAIESDGADTIFFSCSGLFWLRPFVARRLAEIGWEAPVLDGLSTSIALAKTLVDLGLDASGLVYPGDRPRRWRPLRTF